MLIRSRLLLLGLATLALPWAGCQYAREMESSLREAERQSLLAVAQTIATSLQGRRDLISRDSSEGAARPPPGPMDLEPVPLRAAPELDALAGDWPRVTTAWRVFSSPGGDQMRVLAGTHERFVFLLIEVRDAALVFDRSRGAALDPDALGDRLWIGFDDPAGALQQIFLSATAAGTLQGRRIETRELGRPELVDEPRVQGFWQRRENGWRAEIRLPLSMIGDRFGVLLDDRDRRGAVPQPLGSLSPEDLAPTGRMIAAAPELDDYLRRFRQPGVRIVAASAAGGTLAEVNELATPSEISAPQALLSRLYRRFLGRSDLGGRVSETERGRIDRAQAAAAAAGRSDSGLLTVGEERRVVVAAVAPILDSDRRSVIGALQVTQTADRWLLLRDRALTRLLNLTLVVTAVAIVAMFAFGTWLSLRLGRLRRASESALSPKGLLSAEFPDTDARDELGDVSRSFATLLGRLNEYTSYLRTLAGKLAHEIRTPLTIVRSSLENLEAESQTAEARRTYIERARQGSDRLGAILNAMGEATRVEESIANAERARFDLAALLRQAVDAYRAAFPMRSFALQVPEQAIVIEGAADLIMQMLDKLIDNAVDFSAAQSTITLRLREDGAGVGIDVENQGPMIPVDARERLFESLWQSRASRDGTPHFGLGLYIVRLIAEFHGGRARSDNLPDGSGVRFSVNLHRAGQPRQLPPAVASKRH